VAWLPEHTIQCWGCETVERYHLGQGHVPPTWKMVKVEGRYRAFCGACLAALAAEAATPEGERPSVVFVPKREFKRRR
jgi:hypothetical protein